MGNKKGISLIEILVSLFLLSIMLLGLEAAEIKALQLHKSAYYFSTAMQQINQLSERLMACKTNCSEDIKIWNEQNQTLLPQVKSKITGYYPHYVIQLSWGDKQDEDCKSNKIGLNGCLQKKLTVLPWLS